MTDFTRIARPIFASRVREVARRCADTERTQRHELATLLKQARATLWGERHRFAAIDSYEQFAQRVPVAPYATIRPLVMRMIQGEKSILWPGRVSRFAQSSGTSDGKSKYIPITDASLRRNHYAGSADAVAHYLALYPDSRLFSGKSLVLGGSYANELDLPPRVKVGDLSASLIDNINPLVNLFRVPSKRVALMPDWEAKLPALIDATVGRDVTSISGVPSWLLTVLKGVIERVGATTIHDVWPNLEVFFHGGIAFGPYRPQYDAITSPGRLRYLETYNASEGFFATQTAIDDPAMQLIIDAGVFYEFIPLDQTEETFPEALPAWRVEQGSTYALLITACNGLWRFPIGDTVRIESVNPLKITIAGRTRHFINAFGEEVMVHNTDRALAAACAATGATVLNYTAAPLYATSGSRGRHQWVVEFDHAPTSVADFAAALDSALQAENSDYQAKRYKGIFLDPIEVIPADSGLFDRWLASTGKLGGQRKVPRLSNDRRFIDPILAMNSSR